MQILIQIHFKVIFQNCNVALEGGDAMRPRFEIKGLIRDCQYYVKDLSLYIV